MWELHEKCKALRERIRVEQDAKRKQQGKPPLSEYQLDMLVFNGLVRNDWRKPEFLLAAMGHQWGDSMRLIEYINGKRFVNYWAVRMAQEFCKSPLINMLGCASCVAGDTRILNPITGEQPTIAELYERKENPIVMTLQGPKIASVPFIKGNEPLYEITTETGNKFRCSAAHRLLTPEGYRNTLALSVGDELLFVQSLQESTSEPVLSVRAQDVLSFRKTTGGYQVDCPAYLRSCDARPHLEASIDQSFSPSPSDAQGRSRCISSRSDDLALESLCSHLSLSSSRACMQRTFLQNTPSETHDLFRSSLRMRECGDSHQLQSLSLSRSDTHPHSPCESQYPCENHIGSPYSSSSSVEILRSYGLLVSHTKVASIRKTQAEVFYDIQVPDAHHYFAEGAIHHNSGKTFFSTAYCYTLWKARPWNTSVYLSTTTGEGADARAWANIQSLYRDDKIAYGKMLNSVRTLVMEEVDEQDAVHRDLRNAIKCVLIKKGNEGRDVVGAICGRKNDAVIWQAQPLECKLLTPFGWSSIGNAKAGDEILGADGKTYYIKAVHPVSKQNVYRLTFSDGSQTESTHNHVWNLWRETSEYSKEKRDATGNGAKRINKNFIKPLSFFDGNLAKGKTFKKWALPIPSVSKFGRDDNMPLSAYLVGALLGDGCIVRGSGVQFYNMDQDVINEVRKELPPECDMVCVRPAKIQYHIRGKFGKGVNRENPVIRKLKELGLWGHGSHTKFVPKIYLRAGVKTRLAMLQGLMDTDGTVLNSTNRYTSVSDQLKKDVIEIVRSLGGYARQSKEKTVVFNLPGFDCFRMRRQLAKANRGAFKMRRRSLCSVEYVGEKDVRCITTTAPDGLYITDDYIVTHNCDEMPHMDAGVLSGRVNLFSNPFAQFLGIGNGPMPGDPMFIDAEPDEPGGWKFVNRDEHWKWKTRAGVCLYFNGAKSPNMKVEPGEKPPFPRIMDWQTRNEILKACWNDENTPEFFVQFYGFPPSVEVPDTVLTTQFMEAHHAFEQPEWTGEKRKVLAGLDLGFRKDGDPCVLHFGKVGKAMNGKTILGAEPDGIALNPSQKTNEPFEEQIARRVVQECRERDCHDLALDVTGDGGILLQAIEREARSQGYNLKCLAVSFSGIAEDKVVIPGEKRKAREMFDRMVSQLWATCRVCVGNDVVRGLDDRGLATKQLCGRKFSTDEKKRFSVESKKDMKKRIKRSPDQGDAFALLMHLALKHGVSGRDIPQPPKPKTWDDLMKRKGEPSRAYSGHQDTRSYVSH